MWAVEGTGSFGAGLTSLLVDQGELVVEVDRPSGRPDATAPRATCWTPPERPERVLAREQLAQPRAVVTARRCGCC